MIETPWYVTWCPSGAGLCDAGLVELAGDGASVGPGEVGEVGEVAGLGTVEAGALVAVAPDTRGDPLPQPLAASTPAAAQTAILDRINGHLPRT